MTQLFYHCLIWNCFLFQCLVSKNVSIIQPWRVWLSVICCTLRVSDKFTHNLVLWNVVTIVISLGLRSDVVPESRSIQTGFCGVRVTWFVRSRTSSTERCVDSKLDGVPYNGANTKLMCVVATVWFANHVTQLFTEKKPLAEWSDECLSSSPATRIKTHPDLILYSETLLLPVFFFNLLKIIMHPDSLSDQSTFREISHGMMRVYALADLERNWQTNPHHLPSKGVFRPCELKAREPPLSTNVLLPATLSWTEKIFCVLVSISAWKHNRRIIASDFCLGFAGRLSQASTARTRNAASSLRTARSSASSMSTISDRPPFK